MDIAKLLETLADDSVTDILLSAGAYPRVRVGGSLIEKKEYGVTSAADIDRFRMERGGIEGEESYKARGGLDLSVPLTGYRRCRVNFFTTIHGPGMAIRPLRTGAAITFENSSLPESLKTFAF